MNDQSTALRLNMLSNGKSLNTIQKLKLLPIRWSAGKYPGPMLVMSHRRNLVGKHYGQLLHHAMRNSKHWTAGEAELFASFTAKQLRCEY